MAIHWGLKTFLATRHGIFAATDLQKLVIKKTGVLISLTNLCNYLEKKPKTLRLATMEILCQALQCKLEDFCRIKPPAGQPDSGAAGTLRKLSFQNTPHAKRAQISFPDPENYKE